MMMDILESTIIVGILHRELVILLKTKVTRKHREILLVSLVYKNNFWVKVL